MDEDGPEVDEDGPEDIGCKVFVVVAAYPLDKDGPEVDEDGPEDIDCEVVVFVGKFRVYYDFARAPSQPCRLKRLPRRCGSSRRGWPRRRRPSWTRGRA